VEPKTSPHRTLVAGLGLLLSLPLACAPEVIQLRPERGALRPTGPLEPLEMIVSVAGGSDPLPVQGRRIAYGGLTGAVGRFMQSDSLPWAERHRTLRPGGWQMLVEITRSDAEVQAGRLTVELEARVTLRGTEGQIHLGQTHGYCKVAGALVGDGAPVVYQCLERMARDLTGWLEGQNP
jgi:hypothetical protein